MKNEEIKTVSNKMIDAVDCLVENIDCDTCEHYKQQERFENYPCCACIVKAEVKNHWKEKVKPNYHHSFREADDY